MSNFLIDLNDYKVIKEVGHGSSSRVFLVENIKNNQKFAAKVFPKQENFEEIYKILDQFKIYFKIDNPTLIKYYGYSLTNFDGEQSCLTIIMDYVCNGTLLEILKKEKNGESPVEWNETKKLIVIFGIVIGMKYLHKNNIIHGDLRLSNILLNENFNPILSDYGFSNLVNEKATSFSTITEESDSLKFDFYSFSFILYELFSCNYLLPIMNAKNYLDFSNKIISEEKPNLNFIKYEDQRELLNKIWNNDPEDIYSFDKIYSFLLNNKDIFHSTIDYDELNFYIKNNNAQDQYDNFSNEIKYQNDNNTKQENREIPNYLYQNIDELIQYYKKEIEKGDIEAMNSYGYMLQNGEGVTKNYEEAIKYYKMAIEGGSIKAMNNYGYMLQNKKGITRNFEEAIKYYKMAIDGGNSDAMNNYANMLKYGQSFKPDYEEAIKYYKMSIEMGNCNAMYNLANMYRNGEGVKKNPKEAIKYYKMAIEGKNSKAMKAYATMLKYGEGTPKNYADAIKYYKMSIDQGNAEAMYNYANMIKYGEGIESNISEAIKYYKMAIKRGNSDAMNAYANMLKNGEYIQININEAIKYYKMAIERGHSDAMNNYGLMFKYGNGIKKDYGEAIKLFKMAINKGNTNAMVNYGLMLKYGEGVIKNLKESTKYFQMAANKGNKKAYTLLNSNKS